MITVFYDDNPLSLVNIHESRILQFSSNVFKLGGDIQRPHIPHVAIDEKCLITKSMKRQKRKIIAEIQPGTGRRSRWPNNIVPYRIENNLRDFLIFLFYIF